MTTIHDSITERVQSGARFLDLMCPDWEVRVDPVALSMVDGQRCVLGQLFGHYQSGLRKLGLRFGSQETASLGFWNGIYQYCDLTRVWRDEITARRQERSSTDGG
jgi:hypothetical protein